MIMRALWLWTILGLLLLGYVLPYTVLADLPRWWGSFLFWLVFGILVWLILVVAVARWQVGGRQ